MMHIKDNLLVCVTLVLLFTFPLAYADSPEENSPPPQSPLIGDPIAGKIKSQVCQGCHGMDGNSTGEMIPKLSGQYEGYIIKQMRNYLTGVRSHAIMNGMAAQLSEQDVADISAYFSKQVPMKGSGASPSQKGSKLFNNGDIENLVMTCAYCHGVNGKGLVPPAQMYPIIGGQHKAYLFKQLVNFREDDRMNSPSVIMNKIVRSLSDKDIDALAEYISVQ